MVLYYYKKWSSARKAASLLRDKNIDFRLRDIFDEPLSMEDIQELLDVKDEIDLLFSTRGKKFRELELKGKLDSLSKKDKITLLSSNPSLLKRPILLKEDELIIGYNEKLYQALKWLI